VLRRIDTSMNGRRTMPSPRRVVFFAPCAAPGGEGLGFLTKSLGPALECVRAASAYEAAAELLAGPAEVLVVELRVLRPCHLRLLEIARRAGAKTWGVGPVPPWMTNGRLGGVQIMSRAELARALGTLAGQGQAEAQGETPKTPPAVSGVEPPVVSGAEPLLTAEELSALLGDVEQV
jgi:hypothetical protein